MRWRARTIVQRHAAPRASRPQLKRDPLGTHGVLTTSSTYGYALVGVGFIGHLVLLRRLSRYRVAGSNMSLLENWTKAVDPRNYSDQGRRLLRWIWLPVALFAAGILVVIVYP